MIADSKPSSPQPVSGGRWLGNVPEHWRVVKLRHLLKRCTERNRPDLPLLSVVREKGVILRNTKSVDDNHNYIPDDLTSYKVVRAGQFAINKMKAWQGSYGVSGHDGIVSPAYFVYDVSGVDASFFHTAIRSRSYVPAFSSASDGVRIGQWDLAEARMREISFLLPPDTEQMAIVRFLEHVDRLMQQYIRAKQKMIALLEEQKQAVIYQVVTGQIDVRSGEPYEDYTSSEVGCLGDVPECWEVRRFRSLVSRIDQGISPQAENYLADQNSWGVLKAGCVNGGVFRDTEHKRLPSGLEFDAELAVAPGDVLISRASGSPHLVGSVGRVLSLGYRLILSDKTFRPHFGDDVDPDYMVIAMNVSYYRQQVEQAISGAEGLANNLPLSSLRSFWVLVPPISEQKNIVEYVRRTTKKLSVATSDAKRKIALLREYRDRLTSDVVTGNITVGAGGGSGEVTNSNGV